MSEHILRGDPASPGKAAGPALVLPPAVDATAVVVPEAERPAELVRSLAALATAAAELEALAAGVAPAEAEIIEAGALMARDPALAAAVERHVSKGAAAPAALLAAAEEHAALLAAIPDATLAARAADVRSLGRRAARIATNPQPTFLKGSDPMNRVVVADDLGPADVAEHAGVVAAFALAGGGATGHAAIVARSLGIPMVAGAGPGVMNATGVVVVDGDAGEVVLDPAAERVAAAAADSDRRARARERAAAERELPCVTTDGRAVRVLANVAAAAEVAPALDAGAEGVGLLRTELQFLEATAWPTEEEHRRALAPIFAALGGRIVTARVLDFGGDKTPPFLRGTAHRGIQLLLAHPAALEAQLRAIVGTAGDVDLRILLPLVDEPDEIDAVRAIVGDGVAIGAMIETPRAAENAPALAARSQFLSVGTNDLTAATLGVERFAPGAAPAHDPSVLRNVSLAAAAAQERGIPFEVCGEAASDPRTLPLLVGLGVDELSAGAARVGAVRRWVRCIDHAHARALAAQALQAVDAVEVERLVAPTAERLRLLDEAGEAAGERPDGVVRVVAVGPEA